MPSGLSLSGRCSSFVRLKGSIAVRLFDKRRDSSLNTRPVTATRMRISCSLFDEDIVRQKRSVSVNDDSGSQR